jgi:hypothetical protein
MVGNSIQVIYYIGPAPDAHVESQRALNLSTFSVMQLQGSRRPLRAGSS